MQRLFSQRFTLLRTREIVDSPPARWERSDGAALPGRNSIGCGSEGQLSSESFRGARFAVGARRPPAELPRTMMSAPRRWRLLAVFLVALLAGVDAAAWEKLHRCSDVAFCRRHRAIARAAALTAADAQCSENSAAAPAATTPARVDAASVKISDDHRALTGALYAPGSEAGAAPSLRFRLSLLANDAPGNPLGGLPRLQLEDADGAALHARYVVPDDIVDSGTSVALSAERVSLGERSATVFPPLDEHCALGPCVVVEYAPFRVRLRAAPRPGAAVDDVLVVNERDLLHYEQHRAMQSRMQAESDRLSAVENATATDQPGDAAGETSALPVEEQQPPRSDAAKGARRADGRTEHVDGDDDGASVAASALTDDGDDNAYVDVYNDDGPPPPEEEHAERYGEESAEVVGGAEDDYSDLDVEAAAGGAADGAAAAAESKYGSASHEEAYRAAAGSLCDGCGEERLKGSFVDDKPRGAESVGVDVAFPRHRVLCGLPERTLDVALPDTVAYAAQCEDGGEEKGASAAAAAAAMRALTDPLRLYNLDVFEYELGETLGLYGAVPLLLARGGDGGADGGAVGLLWLNAAETYVELSSYRSHRSAQCFSEAGLVDVVLIPGPRVAEVYSRYLALTGRPALPPHFALGYHQSRWNYRDDADVRQVDANFDRHDVAYDVLWLDIEHTVGKRYFTWDVAKFPRPEELQEHLGARGRRMVTIIDPHIKVDEKYFVHAAAQRDGLYVQRRSADGGGGGRSEDFHGWCWPGNSGYIDFTAARAREAWARFFHPSQYAHLTPRLFTWVDMNEPSVFNGPEMTMPKSLLHAGGWQHRDVHNVFGLYVHRAMFDAQRRLRAAEHGGDGARPFVLSRSFFAGSQRYGAVWTGDNTASWAHLRDSVPMLLAMQLSGIVFSGADVGGFFGNPSAELLTRWYQTAAWQPFFRGHAHLDTNRREPWLFGDATTRRIRAAIRARYAHLPLWYTLFAANALPAALPFRGSGGGPPMRPLWWHYESFGAEQRHFLLGNALLVAPVLDERAASVAVRLPASERWFDLYGDGGTRGLAFDARTSAANGTEIPVDMDRMVVFQRGGSIVPRKERVRRSTAAMHADPYTLVVALDGARSARGEVYVDDGVSFAYERGVFALMHLELGANASTLSNRRAAGDATAASGFAGADALVERILLLGWDDVTPAEARVGASPARLQFTHADNLLELKLPGVRMLDEWDIHFLD